MKEGQSKKGKRKELEEVLSRAEEKKWHIIQVMHKIRGPERPQLIWKWNMRAGILFGS